jgi:Holliday junction resolvase RusA-like endonuclease
VYNFYIGVILIKPKNIKKYKELYKHIPSIQFDRIKEFLESKKFTKADYKAFHDALSVFTSRDEVTIKIVIDIIPEPTPRPRLGMGGRFYVKNSRANNEFVELMSSKYEDIQNVIKDKECEIDIKSYFPIPKSFNKVNTLLAELGIIRPITKPDWDNLGKTYSDAIQPWIVYDDSLFIDGSSHKYYSLKPRVEIQIKFYE